MTKLELLRKLRVLLAQPTSWVQHEYAKDSFGADVSPTSEEAIGWCVWGGIARICASDVFDPFPPFAAKVANELQSTLKAEGIMMLVHEYNDSHTHADVLSLIDRTIARLEEHEPGAPLEPIPTPAPEMVLA